MILLEMGSLISVFILGIFVGFSIQEIRICGKEIKLMKKERRKIETDILMTYCKGMSYAFFRASVGVKPEISKKEFEILQRVKEKK